MDHTFAKAQAIRCGANLVSRSQTGIHNKATDRNVEAMRGGEKGEKGTDLRPDSRFERKTGILPYTLTLMQTAPQST